ncbi:MAG: hypothetical protein C0520_07235 [Sphingopyxis sp.]|nr:hypothetical protein [Sphingopyxis sp.]
MIRALVLAAALALAPAASAQFTPADPKATPFLPVADEPLPELFVDPPLAEPLARGAVIIPYRTRHFRILPIFGAGAADVSPRAGHLHVGVDDLPWRWADAGDNESVVVVGLPSGPHKIRIELATPEHRVVAGQTVSFIVP